MKGKLDADDIATINNLLPDLAKNAHGVGAPLLKFFKEKIKPMYDMLVAQHMKIWRQTNKGAKSADRQKEELRYKT